MVERCIGLLEGVGLRCWSDRSVGRQSVAAAIENATSMVFFMSGSAVESRYCYEEVHFALEANKTCFAVSFTSARQLGSLAGAGDVRGVCDAGST